jgi:hypothetical protein
MVDPSGATYFLYEQRFLAYPPQVVNTAIHLMKVEADGTWNTTQEISSTANVNLFPGRVLPDDHGGVVATWTLTPAEGDPDPNPLRAAHVSRTGAVTPYTLPIQPAEVLREPSFLPVNLMLVLGENDTAFASYGQHLASFNLTSGALIWSQTASVPVTMVSSDSQNGLFAKTTSGGTDTVTRFDAAGTPTATSLTGAALDYLGQSTWLGSGASGAAVAYAGNEVVATSIHSSPTMGCTNAATKFWSNFTARSSLTPFQRSATERHEEIRATRLVRANASSDRIRPLASTCCG